MGMWWGQDDWRKENDKLRYDLSRLSKEFDRLAELHRERRVEYDFLCARFDALLEYLSLTIEQRSPHMVVKKFERS